VDPKAVQRKLAAILSADVEGYSRLMSADELATVNTLTEYRQVMAGLIEEHGGRVVDSPGDNLLAEFGSVVDALDAAVDIQKELKVRNESLPAERRMLFRIGLNLGDVILDGPRIYGDGVNIAARLESLAPAGSVCVSGAVHDQVLNKLDLDFVFMGRKEIKNIQGAIRVYCVRLVPGQALPRRRDETRSRPWISRKIILGGLILALVIAGGAIQKHRTRDQSGLGPPAASALELPDKPSIAVLPFSNMSDDPEQDYFSDGMTEDLITSLSKVSGLFVISRNSVFTYKGKSVLIEQVGRELGVRYVLEGSVRKAGNRVRITAQLIDATTGYHVWAERYDRELKNIFGLQDEVARRIVASLKVKLTEGERERVGRKGTDNLQAYDLTLRGREIYRTFTEKANRESRLLFESAIQLDPNYAAAHVGLGWTFFSDWSMGWSHDPGVLDRAGEEARRALALDEQSSGAYALLSWVKLWKEDWDGAIEAGHKAVDLDPNDAEAYVNLADILIWSGQAQEAVGLARKAIRLDPRNALKNSSSLAHAYLMLGRAEEARDLLEKITRSYPDFLPNYFFLAGTYASLGRWDEAREAARQVQKISPGYTLEVARQRLPYRRPEDKKRAMDTLRRVGFK